LDVRILSLMKRSGGIFLRDVCATSRPLVLP
jgi:hypothetical protein